jgi:membrane-bound inhibitor of C-type lysozyme
MFRKITFIATAAFIALFISGCSKEKAVAESEASSNIVEAIIKNDNNEVLAHIVFDNPKDTANVTLPDNKSVILKGVPTASGIKFKNEEYEYSEWKGNIKLTKGSETIFEISTQNN